MPAAQGSTSITRSPWSATGPGSATPRSLPGADPEITEKAERVSSTQANVEGILRWLEKTEPVAG